MHDLAVVDGVLLVLVHDDKVAIRYLMDDLAVCEVERFHESGNLSQQGVVAYNFCFAVRFATLLAKADSLIKFWAGIIE